MLEISTPQYVGVTAPLGSLKILINHLFTISEQHQAYLYQRFIVSVPPDSYANYIFIALALIAVVIAAYIFIMQKLKSKIMCVCILLAITSIQIYFGVFSAPVWNIVLFTVVAWILLHEANIMAFAGFTVAVVFAAMLAYPGANSYLAELSEAIRDQFGERVERPVVMAAAPQEISAIEQAGNMEMREEAIGQDGNHEGGQEYGIHRDERFAGSQIGAALGQRLWVLWLIGLAFAIGFVVRFLLKLKDAYKRRGVFNSQDCAAAIDSMFKHIIEWLIEFGVDPLNRPFADYAEQIKIILPGEHCKNYLEILYLWQEAVYSSHTMTENDKKQVRLFLNNTKRALVKTQNPFTGQWVKFRLFLRNGVQNAEV